jgi:branched-chain amino acid transport system permease protein
MLSIQYLAMIIVGGVGSILGSIYGATFITLLPEVIRLFTDLFREEYPTLTTRFADLKSVTFGLIIILFLIFGPKGLYGKWRDIKVYWNNWPFTY